MNDLLYQFQTIGFACDREYHLGMKDVKKSYREMSKFREKSLKQVNADSLIDSISSVINNKIEPLSRSVDCRSLNKTQRLQQCLNRMSKIDHDQQILDRQYGNRAMSIFSEKINQRLPPQQNVNEVSEEVLLNGHLKDENLFREVMERSILLHQFHKECNQKYSKDTKNWEKNHDIQKYYLKKYQVNHLRLQDKLIDSERKTVIEHKCCLDRTQLLKSSRNTRRIKEVTEKLNKNKIKVIQNLFQTGHAHKSQQAAEVLKFLDIYSKLDRENQGFFEKYITIKEGITMKSDVYLRRVFFKFSNKKCEDQNLLYKYINREGYNQLFQTTQIDIDNYELDKIYEKNMQVQTVNQENGLIYNFFRDSLIDLANCITLLPTKEEKLQKLIGEDLTVIYDQVLDPNELRLLNIKCYQNFMSLFRQPIEQIFVGERMNLDKIIQLFMKIKVFPNKLQKSFLRFYYYYVWQDDLGLNIEEFHHFINLMALAQNKRVAISKELHNIIQYNNFKLNQKCDEIQPFELTVFRKIVIFYFHTDFLNLLDTS